GDRERDDTRGVRRAEQTAALYSGKMLANRVHLGDRHAALKEQFRRRAFVGQSETGRRLDQQRRPSAHEKNDDQTIRGPPGQQPLAAARGVEASRVRQRMAGDDDLYARQATAYTAVANDEKPFFKPFA